MTTTEKTQKTWAEVLGSDATNCAVEGRFIVRIKKGRRRVLWTFENNEDACAVFTSWIESLESK